VKLSRSTLALGPYLAEFRVSAFRLECRQHYDNPTEREWFARYLQTGEVPVFNPDNDAWCKLVAEARAAGKAVQRVHLVQEPPSDYVRFELECQQASLNAGEDIRVIAFRDSAEAPPLGDPGHLGDFWLFDDETVVELDYDQEGRFLGARQAQESIEYYHRLRDEAMKRSISLKEYSYIL
jgi:uncharacterized protein DUF6879